jgi:hypothetical protein
MKNSWEENYKKACKESERISPWFWVFVLMFILALSIPFISLGAANGVEMANTLKDNRVYISKDTYDNFVRSNP